MNSDSLYNFNPKSDDNDSSIKINMDELYIKKQQQDLNVLNNYNKILTRIHNKIKYVSKQLINDQCCWYVMPEMLIGVPKYDHNDCSAYVIEKLRINGFVVRYIHPNLLFISWKHWVPTYVRNEIKNKTGQIIDEYGNIKSDNDSVTFNNPSSSNSEKNDNINNIIFNNKSKVSSSNNKSEKDYKDIKTYKPSGVLFIVIVY